MCQAHIYFINHIFLTVPRCQTYTDRSQMNFKIYCLKKVLAQNMILNKAFYVS